MLMVKPLEFGMRYFFQRGKTTLFNYFWNFFTFNEGKFFLGKHFFGGSSLKYARKNLKTGVSENLEKQKTHIFQFSLFLKFQNSTGFWNFLHSMNVRWIFKTCVFTLCLKIFTFNECKRNFQNMCFCPLFKNNYIQWMQSLFLKIHFFYFWKKWLHSLNVKIFKKGQKWGFLRNHEN